MYARLCAVALLTAVMAGPAVAQTATTTPPGTTAVRPVPVDDRRDNSNWGWLGLLGLVGLAPLFMRKDRQGNVHADTRR